MGILCMQGTQDTEQEMRSALRPAVRDGELHIASSDGTAGGIAVLVEGRVQRVTLVDKEPPHRTLVIWNIHNFGIGEAEARRIDGPVYREVARDGPT